MKKLVKLLIYTLIGIISFASFVYGKESEIVHESSIDVEVVNEEGVKILTRDGEIIYSNCPLNFLIKGSAEFEEGEVENEKLYYSFSYDGGISFSDKYEMTSNDLRLSFEGDNEEYYLRFFKETRIKNVREIVGENETETDNEEKIENEEKIDSGKEIEYEVDITTVYETSKVFHVLFDLSTPAIDIIDDSIPSEWVNSPINAFFRIEDNISGISRVVITSSEKILYEYHQADLKEKELKVNTLLDEVARDVKGTAINITAVDLAGNILEKNYTYFLDLKAPELTANLPSSELITNSDVNFSIIAEDNIKETARVFINILKKNRGTVVSYLDKIIDGKAEALSFEDTISEDGEYDITVFAKDLAGNESEKITTHFRIDKTLPLVEINGFEHGKDYRQNVNAIINLSDEFFADSKVHIKVTRLRPKETVVESEDFAIPIYENFQRSICLKEDGDYIILAEMTDRAGNYRFVERNVRVDKTPPDLSIFGMTDNQITKGIPNLIVSLNELFYDSARVSLESYVKNSYGIYEKIMTEDISMSDEYFETPYVINKEGEYFISLKARDRAGNESYKSIEFIYDCTSPYIGWIQNYNKKYITSMTFPKDFRENIKDMTTTSYLAFINARDLKEGTVIKNDGKYVLRIIASDAAGNVSDEAVEFIIDNTAPKIVAKGITSSRKVKIGDVVEFSLYDKEDVFTKCTYKGKDVLSSDKLCRIKIEGEGEQEIILKAVDLAGNETEKVICLSASVFSVPKGAQKAIKTISQNVQNVKNDNSSLIIDKNKQEKSPIIFASFILGLFMVLLLIIGIRSRIDTTK